ncbi:ComF family protein [Candidatus Poribacteria bacterium]|nr:ComF family protein [Candidatus Poribacteria bacterium]
MIQQVIETALTFLYPAHCKVCEKTIGLESIPYLCGYCWDSLEFVTRPWCEICGIQSNEEICSECATTPPRYGKLRTIAFYGTILQKIIHLYKFEKKRSLAKYLSDLMIRHLPNDCNFDEYDYILPIPIHKNRLRERGFNQSILISKGISKEIGIDICTDALVRSKNTSPQSSLARDARQSNIVGAFEIKNKKLIEGKRILIFDDVYTTGATVNEAVNMLWNEDPLEIDVLTLARTVNL